MPKSTIFRLPGSASSKRGLDHRHPPSQLASAIQLCNNFFVTLTVRTSGLGAPIALREKRGLDPGRCYILQETAREHHWHGTGLLSIKSFAGGRAHYDVGCGHYAVDDASYLVLNEGQRYAINIESARPVESFCLFFARGFVEEVQRSLALPTEQLLDSPDGGGGAPVKFFEKNYPHDQVISPALFRLRAAVAKGAREEGWLLEQLHGIVQRLLRIHRLARKEAERLHSVRRATREESYRRVCRAQEYAAALFAEPVTLGELARVACLSPNHLLRTFRQAFGQTPHQYLTSCRLIEARRLLAQGDLPVTEVCLAVGFESLGSFSALFRRRFGVPPSSCRRQKGDFEEADIESLGDDAARFAVRDGGRAKRGQPNRLRT